MSSSPYFEAFDPSSMAEDYPLGEAFLDRFTGLSADELFALQDRRFRGLLDFAWRIPFYRRLWGARGLEPGDVPGLAQIDRLPVFDKEDLMRAVEAHPPFGDFDGADRHPDGHRRPVIVQTTSGTTGRPQPLLFGPESREMQALLLARLYRLQGLTADDIVHSVYGHGMVNGGHYVREAVLHWLGARMLTAGTGIETRSAQQVRLMHEFGATALIGFGDFVRRLAEVAQEEGLIPGEDIPLRVISGHFGQEGRDAVSAAWGGAAVFDWYGVGDTGAIAGEGPDRDGLHVLEDAQFVELHSLDGDGRRVPAGTEGDLVCTCLYKRDVFPIIRFNTHDVSRVRPGDSALGLPFRRIDGFLGRSDDMVKVRGINVYPQGIGTLLAARHAEATGEFYCRLETGGDAEEAPASERLTVVVEVSARPEGLADAMADSLRERLGVGLAVELVAPGETAAVTQIERRQKPLRLLRTQGGGGT